MEELAIVSAIATAFAVTVFAMTVARARTAPALFGIALVAVVGLAVVVFANLSGTTGLAAATLALCLLTLIIAAILGPIMALRPLMDHGYEADGSDLDAIRRACDARERADRIITSFQSDRRAMPLMERLRDAFVTTDHERDHGAALSTRTKAMEHLRAIVPQWHGMRTESLVDGNHVRVIVDEIETRLRPLETTEEAARDLHRCATDALIALDRALEAIESATTYETLDLVSNNTGISAVSTIASSEAADRVGEARASIERLSQATRSGIDQELLEPDDVFDLVLDMTLGDMFDFMSLFMLGKLSDAKTRCEEARQRVVATETRLATTLASAHSEAQVVRDEVAAVKKPYRDAALREMPESARGFVTGR